MIHARKDYTNNIVDVSGKIGQDEPVFLLLGRDPAAKAAVQAWCNETRRLGGNELADHVEKKHLPLMNEWPKKKKVADCDATLFTDYEQLKKRKEAIAKAKKSLGKSGVDGDVRISKPQSAITRGVRMSRRRVNGDMRPSGKIIDKK